MNLSAMRYPPLTLLYPHSWASRTLSNGLVCKRLKQSDCKSDTTGFGGSNPSQPTLVPCRSGQTAQPAKLLNRRFESDWNLFPKGFPLGSLVNLVHGFHHVMFRYPPFGGAPGHDFKGGSHPTATALYCLFSSAG